MTPLRRFLLWSATVFISAVFVLAGLFMLCDPVTADKFHTWHYPDWLRWVVGLVELTGAVFVLFPRLASCSAAALAVVMLGAILTLVRADDYSYLMTPFLMLWILGYVMLVRLPQSPWGLK